MIMQRGISQLPKSSSANLPLPALLTVFLSISQYKPVNDVQSAVPHLQSIPGALDFVPSATAHVDGGRFEQVLEVATQYIPEVKLQVTLPQTHALVATLD